MATLAQPEPKKSQKFTITIVYNGVVKEVEVNADQAIRAVLEHAIRSFGITQQQHLLGLFTEQGVELSDTVSVENAGVKPGETLLLRPSAVRAG